MNFRNARTQRWRGETTLELTPLIDVVFLLLIFFLVTTTFADAASESEIPINLPHAMSGQQAQPEQPIVLYVTSSGEIILESNGHWEHDDIRHQLQKWYEDNPQANILLKGDLEASHGKVVEILDLIKQVGFTKVNLVISKNQ